MKFPTHPGAAVVLLVALMLSFGAAPAWAGGGHAHGDAPVAAAGSALPRFAAVSELFELVGVIDGRKLTLYLDRSLSNCFGASSTCSE